MASDISIKDQRWLGTDNEEMSICSATAGQWGSGAVGQMPWPISQIACP